MREEENDDWCYYSDLPSPISYMKKENMEINNFDVYRDGGTIEVVTDKGIFCFDGRIGSNTKGRLYDGYPKSDNSNLIENSESIEAELIEGLKLYKNNFYQESIDYFINSKQN
jgi:hypothetical protein